MYLYDFCRFNFIYIWSYFFSGFVIMLQNGSLCGIFYFGVIVVECNKILWLFNIGVGGMVNLVKI